MTFRSFHSVKARYGAHGGTFGYTITFHTQATYPALLYSCADYGNLNVIVSVPYPMVTLKFHILQVLCVNSELVDQIPKGNPA